VRSKKPFSAPASFVTFITLLQALTITANSAQAQKFQVLHTFKRTDGAGPNGLTRDAAGNIYGTTTEGGTGTCMPGPGCGTAFEINKYGTLVWSHSFKGWNGRYPFAGLLRDAAGNLYGTTVAGGAHCPKGYGFRGCGTVFKLGPFGQETLLDSFAGPPDGVNPEALLVRDSAGNLYGTTYQGGAFDNGGTVFRVDATGKETVLHSFAGTPDGEFPYTGVIRDAAGNLYGVTDAGGAYCCGTVYKIDTTGKETILYNFRGYSDGDGPDSVLLMDSAGNLYGNTQWGGNSECGGSGCGVVFKLSPHPDGSWAESVLYVFCSLSNCTDGERPQAGPLVLDKAGNLYGTTIFGGTYRNCNGDSCGIVFKLDVTGKETVLHSFTGGKDGATPGNGLTMDAAGHLYGTTGAGGDKSACPVGCGVVFKITP
jgi:uncharacterized repeat protein (TIGR03803 family)